MVHTVGGAQPPERITQTFGQKPVLGRKKGTFRKFTLQKGRRLSRRNETVDKVEVTPAPFLPP